MNEVGRRAIPCTELPELTPGQVFQEEWNTYRRVVGRLLADGCEGKFVLIKGRDAIGVYETWDAARVAGLGLYPSAPFFVKRILAEEPVLRTRGYSLPCPG